MLNPFKWSSLEERSAQLDAFQKKLEHTKLLVFDEISMLGRQIMGKIDDRCSQGKTAEQNPNGATLGGLSCVGVGDPAQCPPIKDDVFYDVHPHKDTHSDPDATRVRMSNAGLHVFSTFGDVIVLQICHRIHKLEGAVDEKEAAEYNARGQRFLEVVTRLRDCTWTEEDYYWLSQRKLSHISLEERAKFKEAPVLMEFRKERESEDPNDSCVSYNRRHLYMLAKDGDIPVARFPARHTGVSEEDGEKMSEEAFSGLSLELELCEGAPILSTSNVWVSAGIMNGTRGTIRAIVHRRGDRPDHEDPTRRLPHVILVECPKYSGPAFSRRKAPPGTTSVGALFPARGFSRKRQRNHKDAVFPNVGLGVDSVESTGHDFGSLGRETWRGSWTSWRRLCRSDSRNTP